MTLLAYPTSATCANHHVPGLYQCNCEREAAKLARKAKRDRAVAAVTNALVRHGVSYETSGIAHVVLVTPALRSPVYLSLKSCRDDAGYTIYRYRPAQTSSWCTMRRDRFFTWLNTVPAPVVPGGLVSRIPFGKYAGELLTDVAQKDKAYLFWVLGLPNLYVNLRYAVQQVVNHP